MISARFKSPVRHQMTCGKFSGLPKEFEPPLVELWKFSGLPIKEFELLYITLLSEVYKIAVSFFSNHSEQEFESLLLSLGRAIRIRQSYLLPKNATAEDIRSHANLYTYALVSVAVLRWLDKSKFISIPIEQLAWSIMPTEGFEWIRSFKGVLDDWFHYLRGKEQGIFFEILSIAQPEDDRPEQKKCEQRTAQENPASDTFDTNLCGQLPLNTNKQSFTPGKQQKGWTFIGQLKQALTRGELPVNEIGALIHVNCRGQTLLVNPQIFEWFESVSGAPAKRTKNQFTRLGIHDKRSNQKSLFVGSDISSPPRLYKGFVVSDTNVFWDGKPPTSHFKIRR